MNEFYLKDEFLLKSLFIFILIIIYYLEENDVILDYYMKIIINISHVLQTLQNLKIDMQENLLNIIYQ